MMLQGGVTYEKESPERKVYIANLMYRYPEETETIELIPTETIVYNNSFGRTNEIVEQGRLRDIREEQEIRAREARLQRRNTPEKPARQRIDYINKVGNVKDFGVPQVNENVIMKAKKQVKPEKNYEEIANLFYPSMTEESQIQVKKKEPMLLGESSVLEKPDMITLADKEYEVKPVDKKEENKDKEMEAEKKTDWIMPVSVKYRISSKYGDRIHPVLKEKKFHDGIDIAVPINTPVKAVADGIVERVLWNGGYGKYVQIKHNNSLSSFYAHLNSWDVKVGDIVKQGQEIAKSGNTAGKSSNGQIMTTGPHLHLGAKKNGKTVDPLLFFNEI